MKTRVTYLAVCILFLLFMNGCTKSDLPEPGAGFSRVRLFDDTLADPRNHSQRIAAGNGRLLMTYGRFFEYFLSVNGAFLWPPPAENVWMLTDNEGNLIKRDTFPKGLAMGDIVSLADNSFMVVTYIGVPNLQSSYRGMQLIHIDPNGVMSGVDTLDLPLGEPIMNVHGIHLCRLQNGNATLYFDYYSQNYTARSFVGELNLDGDFLWHQDWLDVVLTGCIANKEGGYMMTGTIPLYYYRANVFVMKTNGTGDSLWNKILTNNTPTGGQIIPAGNGNYRFHYSDYDPNTSAYVLSTYVNEINTAGEFLKTDSFHFGINTSMLKAPDGIFILSGNDAVYGNVSNQFNTSYITLDAGLHVTEKKLFQQESSDVMNAGCQTSDGTNACFGLMQGYDKHYYKPALIIVN